jgi:hypothetical protein
VLGRDKAKDSVSLNVLNEQEEEGVETLIWNAIKTTGLS